MDQEREQELLERVKRGELKLINPKYDFIFKDLFGNENNIEEVSAFLKSILDIPAEEYGQITFLPTATRKRRKDEKQGIVDIRLKTKMGKIVNIEVQVLDRIGFEKRVLFYNAKMMTGQISAGEDYSKINKTISIIITTDFEILKDVNAKNYWHTFHFCDKNKGVVFSDLQEIHTIELRKAPNPLEVMKEQPWVAFFKAQEGEEFMAIAEQSVELKKTVVKLAELSEEEWRQVEAEYEEKVRRDKVAREEFERLERENWERDKQQAEQRKREIEEAEQKSEQRKREIEEAEQKIKLDQQEFEQNQQKFEQAKLILAKKLLHVVDPKTIADTIGLPVELIEKLKTE